MKNKTAFILRFPSFPGRAYRTCSDPHIFIIFPHNLHHGGFLFLISNSLPSHTPKGILFLSLLTLLLDLVQLLNLLVEAAGGDLVQAEDVLVGVLDEDELGVLRLGLEAHIGNGADNTPAVGELEVHLVGEVLGLPANNAENDVLVVDLGVNAGDETIGGKSG